MSATMKTEMTAPESVPGSEPVSAEVEPVAWKFDWLKGPDADHMLWYPWVSLYKPMERDMHRVRNIEPLYAHPAPQPPQRAGGEPDSDLRVPNMGCEHCIHDGDKLLPHYGVAPHECFWKKDTPLGTSTLLPRDQWPPEFVEDVDSPGCGTYHCEHCYSDIPLAHLVKVVKLFRAEPTFINIRTMPEDERLKLVAVMEELYPSGIPWQGATRTPPAPGAKSDICAMFLGMSDDERSSALSDLRGTFCFYCGRLTPSRTSCQCNNDE